MTTEHAEWERACERVEDTLRKALDVIAADADQIVARAAKAYREVIFAVEPEPEPERRPAEEFSAVDRHLPGAVDGVDLGNTGSVS